MRWFHLLLLPCLLSARELPRGIATWDRVAFGNHRFVLKAPAADAVRLRLPWRLRTPGLEDRQLILVDAATGHRLPQVARRRVDREACELIFQPERAGEVWLYPLPYAPAQASPYPDAHPLSWSESADPAWKDRHPAAEDGRLPEATALGYEAVSPYHAFTDMEFIATAEELRVLSRLKPECGGLAFPEDRTHPIRMRNDLPQRWAEGPRAFHGEALRDESYAFQVGLWARRELRQVTLRFSDLTGPRRIPATALRCVNQTGTLYQGEPFHKALSIPAGQVQALWCLLQVPADAAPGEYHGNVEIHAAGEMPQVVPLTFTVAAERIAHHGDDDPWRLSRLRWLDEQLGTEPTVVPPFQPLRVNGERADVLGRTFVFGALGLPSHLESHFTPELTGVTDAAQELLAAPLAFEAVDPAGKPLPWTTAAPSIVRNSEAEARITAVAQAGSLRLATTGTLSFDGALDLQLALTAEENTDLGDLRLVVPLRREMATHFMGLGRAGGKRPERLHWTWDVATKNQDALWIGAPQGGIHLALHDEHYVRPLNTNFYAQRPLRLPASWGNGGRGSVQLSEEGETIRLLASGGPRRMAKGETLRFDLRILFTPFKPIAPQRHFQRRFFHAFKAVEEVRGAGANVINVHHDTAINPYINYPFLRAEAMRAYATQAHEAGMAFKIYNTVRELTTRAPELWALRSLGDEVLAQGPGKGSDWCVEHLDHDFLGGWFAAREGDSSLVTLGMSRWHNFYVSGLDWLARHVGIDGLYLDDVAFDRSVMLRARRVLAAARPDPLVDLHSANQHNARDGFNNSALLYMELFPFLDRLWFGEYFDYSKDPDYWLVEVSGLPYGLMGEMLEGGGNPWRGMVFGMTARYPWEGQGDPRPLWKAWDELGLPQTDLVGWWSPRVPVKTGREDLKASVFRGSNRALIALASWAPTDVDARLDIDWKGLGLDPTRCRLRAPAIPGFQPERTFSVERTIPIPRGKGWLLVIEADPAYQSAMKR